MPELNDRYEQTRIKDLCGLYNVQNCHLCDDTKCGDNLKWRNLCQLPLNLSKHPLAKGGTAIKESLTWT